MGITLAEGQSRGGPHVEPAEGEPRPSGAALATVRKTAETGDVGVVGRDPEGVRRPLALRGRLVPGRHGGSPGHERE